MKKAGLIVLLSVLGVAAVSVTAAFAYDDKGGGEFWFYPSEVTYVNREFPTTDVGTGSSELMVRDKTTGLKESGHYTNMHVARSYMRFDESEFVTALGSSNIQSASLMLYLKPKTNGDSDVINVRLVTGASTLDYFPGLTWDAQADLGITFGEAYAARDVSPDDAGASGTPLPWTDYGSFHDMAELVGGWRDGGLVNYGFILENDFDGKWKENSSTDYTVDFPDEMNELETYFVKGQSFPFLKVTTVPVPEPVSSALFILGAGAFGLRLRRRKA